MKTTIKQQKDGSYLVVIAGRIDGDTAEDLTRQLTCLQGQVKWLTLDIEGLEHIGAAGIRAFLKIRNVIEDNGVTVLLTTPNGAVRTIFDIFKFDNLFNYITPEPNAQLSAEVAA